MLRKARELENEMKAIRQAKIDVVVRQFEHQLVKEAELEDRRHAQQLRDAFESKVAMVEGEKGAQVSEVDKLIRQVNDQIAFLKVVAGELESKKGELQSTAQAAA